MESIYEAQARAAEVIQRNPAKYAHCLPEEAGGDFDLSDLRLSRIPTAPPAPYTWDASRKIISGPWAGDWPMLAPPARTRWTIVQGNEEQTARGWCRRVPERPGDAAAR